MMYSLLHDKQAAAAVTSACYACKRDRVVAAVLMHSQAAVSSGLLQQHVRAMVPYMVPYCV